MATYKTKRPYMYGTGRRKSSIARIHLIPNGTGVITINGRDIDEYFGLETLKLIVRQPLVTTNTLGKVDIEATVSGGGVSGQAGAIRHGIARALLAVDESYRPALKAAGFLTRDPRMKERKKYGLTQGRGLPHTRPENERAQKVRSQGRPPRSAVQQALIEASNNQKAPEPSVSGFFYD